MVLPKLVQNEEELLGTAEGKDWEEDASAALDDVVDDSREAFLADLAGLVDLEPVGGLDNEHVGLLVWDFCGHQVAVLDARVVAGVEDLDAGNLDHKHGGAQDVPCVVPPELDSVHLEGLVVVAGGDLGHGRSQVLLVVQHVVNGHVGDLDKVLEDDTVHRLCCVCHVHRSLKVGLEQQVWQRSCVVQVKVRHQQEVDFIQVCLVKEGE